MAFVHLKSESELLGQTRSEQCRNLRKVYGISGGMNDEQLARCEHLERKCRDELGDAPWIPGAHLDEDP